MDIVRIFKAFFVALLIVLFVFVVASAYRQYSLSTELATLSDGATGIATQLALDRLAHVDEAGKHPYVIGLNKLKEMGDENFTRLIGNRTYEFHVRLLFQRAEENEFSFGKVPPEDRTRVALVLPTAVYEGGQLTHAKLEVITWLA